MLPILKIMSNYLSRLWNRQLLVFLFFLALSTAFWVFMAGKEQREVEFDVALHLKGVPDNVVITTEPPKKISFTLRDEVFTLLNYRYNKFKHLEATIDWRDVSSSGGHVRLLSTQLLKPIIASLHNTTEVVTQRPDTIEFFYNYGLSKKVDVCIQGHIEADSAYSVLACDVYPRKVTIYAAQHVLDTITGAYIRPVNLTQLTDTTSIEVGFQHVKGIKYVPEKVRLTAYADRLVEKTVQVPVRGVNFPAGKTLRTFPPKVEVTFQVGTSLYKKIEADAFTIVVNYADLIDNTNNRIPLRLKSTPEGVRRAHITPAEVEYIIEEETEQ